MPLPLDLDEIHRIPLQDFFRLLGAHHHGLQPDEALRRLGVHGPNRISERPPLPLWKRLGKHLSHRFALLLILGSVLCSFAERLQPGEGMAMIGYALVVVVLINAAFTFWQESKAEATMAAFRGMLAPRARVWRGGQELEVPASELVPGDLMILREGDGIPADARLVELHALKVNNASLTGESEPQLRSLESTSAQRADARNLVFSGTLVSAGSGKAVIYATGDSSELGRIARQTLATTATTTPMQREIAYFVEIISRIAVILGLLFFALGSALGSHFWSNITFAIGIIVANVPEGLLPTVTMGLSLAALRMSRRRALVKTLESVETLGRVTVICTDKTGTLTSNTMRAHSLFLGLTEFMVRDGQLRDAAGSAAPQALTEHLLTGLALCNNANIVHTGTGPDTLLGDPTEGALLLLAQELGTEPAWTRQNWPRLLELPFSSESRSMTTVCKRQGVAVAYLKGAPEVVLARCSRLVLDSTVPSAITDTTAELLREQSRRYAAEGRRVLALAYRMLEEGRDPEVEASQDDYVFLGLVALYDPPRPELSHTVARCRGAGIRIIVVSGDHPLTVESIAREVGIVTSPSRVLLTGQEMEGLSDPELLARLREPEVVLARTSPLDKLRVVELLQKDGEIVAVTGDGVNDAPALKRAEIGVAMGLTGTDVAKEAAQIVLADDNFSTIVAAVEEGRVIYGNIRKFIAYVLTSNVPEILPYIGFVLLGIPLPLSVVLILAIDLGTDMLPAIGLAAESREDDVMEQPPLDPRSRLLSRQLLLMSYGVYGLIESLAGFAGYFAILLDGGWRFGQALPAGSPEHRQAMAAFFVSIVIAQVGNVMACRTRRQSVFSKGLLGNRMVLAGIALELLLAWMVVSTPLGNAVFTTAPLPAWAWILPIPFALTLLAVEESRKWLLRRGNRFVAQHLSW